MLDTVSIKVGATDLERLKNPETTPPLGAKADAAQTATKPKAKAKTNTIKTSGGHFKASADGVFYQADDAEPRKICGPLWLVAQVRNVDGAGWAVLVKLHDLDGSEKEHMIPRSKLLSDQSSRVLEELADLGLWFSFAPDTKKLLLQYLQSGAEVPRARLIPTTGWHKEAFVLPDEIIGRTDEALLYSGNQDTPVKAQGTFEGWRDGVARFAIGNPLLLFLMGAAFAGPLLRLTGLDTGGFHVYGSSKTGKSTICDVAVSIYDKPNGDVDGYRRTWKSTATAIEYTSATFNDLPLFLDEIGEADGKTLGPTVYMLSQGRGKARGRDGGGLREATSWKCFLISSGEHDLATELKIAGVEIKAGQAVRLISIFTKGEYGVLDDLHGFNSGAEICGAMKEAALLNYGVVGREFITALTKADRDQLISQMKDAIKKFALECVPVNASGQVRHAVQYFALAAYAGELATSYSLTGWPLGAAWEAAKCMFADWLQHRGGADDEENRQIIRQIRYFFEQHGMSRFHRWNDEVNTVIDTHGPKTLGMCGFAKTMDIAINGQFTDVKASEVTYYVYRESWANDVLKGRDLKRANKLLLEMGVLTPSKDGKSSRSGKLPGSGRANVGHYLVNPAMLYSGGDD
ncbi:DUF927 domain-containing protein [Iodobacter sp.]|uniref:DUF927 domain-containing protein n=1 Tax=Iodobacter sp. TaxID=1915058 RepID=UPI0025E4BCB0|nr:DUF927 domain-containing protein [Iodobacter sp.]